MLIGAGSAICCAAAVMAAEPVVKARAEQVTVALATVVVFGTVSIFLYPVLFELTQQWLLLLFGWLLAGGALINHWVPVLLDGRRHCIAAVPPAPGQHT